MGRGKIERRRTVAAEVLHVFVGHFHPVDDSLPVERKRLQVGHAEVGLAEAVGRPVSQSSIWQPIILFRPSVSRNMEKVSHPLNRRLFGLVGLAAALGLAAGRPWSLRRPLVPIAGGGRLVLLLI